MRLWIAIVVVSIVAVTSLIIALLLPPERLTLAAGPEGGAYARVAEQYREILARDNIQLDIQYTGGSVDNVAMLEAKDADVALLQGGVSVATDTAEAIGGIFFEPMLFVVRSGENIPRNPALWRDLRITSGAQGSGTAAAFADFQVAVGLDPEANVQMGLGYDDAIAALENGDVDLAVFVTTVDAPYLARAYNSSSLTFLPLVFVDAISRRLEYATVATIPSGAISLAPVVPPAPQKVLALEARLAIQPKLHPALVNRLTMAAKELHATRDIITGRNTFPTVEGTYLPVNSAARQLIQEGPSTWHQLLPYWIAAQLNRLLILILPVLLIFVPMLRVFPALYAYFNGWRVWQHYPLIRQLEDELANQQDTETLTKMDQQLNEMDDKIARLRLPAAYRQAAYHARVHIDLVRRRIQNLRQDPHDT